MKKFVFMYHGAWPDRTQENMDAWMSWFAEIGDSIVDSGNPLGPGRDVTRTGSQDLAVDADAVTGYSIVQADSVDDAEKLLANCPIVTSVRIYEALPM